MAFIGKRSPSRIDAATLRAHWGVDVDGDGGLTIGAVPAATLADRFGTPLHVVNAARFDREARAFAEAFTSRYPAAVEVYLAAKANAVCGVLDLARAAGLRVEVFTAFELRLARAAGYAPGQIIVNGPAKTRELLEDCVDAGVHLVIVDSPMELRDLEAIAARARRRIGVLLRVNVDCVPRGMNPGTATGSRRSVFGMDWHGEELLAAVRFCLRDCHLDFRGLHMHIGSGIRQAADYAPACARLCETAGRIARETGAPIACLDVGGGFGSPMVREFSALEFLRYHVRHRLPRPASPDQSASFADFAAVITTAVLDHCRRQSLPLPTLLLEPGRCLTGPNQILLLRVLRTKQRPGLRPWIITDGGQMTVNFPTFYEYHAMVSCRQPLAPAGPPVDVIGAGCHAADVVSRDRRLPPLREGDALAIMDAGAYFLPFEGNFGFPRAAVVSVAAGMATLVRRRETYDDMLARDAVAVEVET